MCAIYCPDVVLINCITSLFLRFSTADWQVTKFLSVVEPQVQHRSLYNNPPLLLILTKMNLVSIIQRCFFDIHTNMILPSICVISKCRHFAAGFLTRILHAFLVSSCLLHVSPTHLCCMRLEDTQTGREWRV